MLSARRPADLSFLRIFLVVFLTRGSLQGKILMRRKEALRVIQGRFEQAGSQLGRCWFIRTLRGQVCRLPSEGFLFARRGGRERPAVRAGTSEGEGKAYAEWVIGRPRPDGPERPKRPGGEDCTPPTGRGDPPEATRPGMDARSGNGKEDYHGAED